MNRDDLRSLEEACKQIREVRRISGHAGKIFTAGFSPDGRLLASGSDDQTVRLWNPDSGQELRCLQGHGNTVWSVSFSPDGRLLASGSHDNTVRLWNPDSGQELRCLQGHGNPVWSVSFSPDGRLLASGSGDKTVRLWNPDSGQELRCLQGHGSTVWSVSFSPDGRLLASGSHDNTVRLWNPDSGQELRCLQGHGNAVYSVSFSPDGRLLASGSEDNTVRLWNPDSGQELRCLQGHGNSVLSVSFSPDGRLLASGSSDNTVRLWNPDSGQTLAQRERSSGVYYVPMAFSPDGRWFAHDLPPDGRAICLVDVSMLDIGPKDASQKSVALSASAVRALESHTQTLLFVHHSLPWMPAAGWVRNCAALDQVAPLCLVSDLGTAIATARESLELARPAHLPADVRTDYYLDFLKRFTAHPLIRRISSWQLNDTCVGVIVARLLTGCEFPEGYALPTGEERVAFCRVLAERLRDADPAKIWRQTPAEKRPVFEELITGQTLSRIETNLQALSLDELRLLREYGPGLTGAPDPRELVDSFNLLGLPASLRRSLSQVLRLVPRISRKVSGEHAQTYAIGGYAGLTRKGHLDNLLPTELAFPREIFWHRLLNREALYYAYESEQEKRRELVYLVTQMGLEIQGDAEVLAHGLTLALAQTLAKRGYAVRHSFVGSVCSDGLPLDRAAGVYQLLYYRDPGPLDTQPMLEAVLQRLRGWSEEFRQITVYWIVGEHWDADEAEEHHQLYAALRQKARQEAWFVATGGDGHGRAGAKVFDRCEAIDTGLLWAEGE